MRVAPQKQGRLAARISGSQVIGSDGRVLASLRPGGHLTVRGFGKGMRLRGCALIDEEGTEVGLARNGEFWSKPLGQRRFSLPAGV